jgi:hypothetical protein
VYFCYITGIIKNCKFEYIIVSTTENFSALSSASIISIANKGLIDNCKIFTCECISASICGGITGYNYGTIQYCYLCDIKFSSDNIPYKFNAIAWDIIEQKNESSPKWGDVFAILTAVLTRDIVAIVGISADLIKDIINYDATEKKSEFIDTYTIGAPIGSICGISIGMSEIHGCVIDNININITRDRLGTSPSPSLGLLIGYAYPESKLYGRSSLYEHYTSINSLLIQNIKIKIPSFTNESIKNTNIKYSQYYDTLIGTMARLVDSSLMLMYTYEKVTQQSFIYKYYDNKPELFPFVYSRYEQPNTPSDSASRYREFILCQNGYSFEFPYGGVENNGVLLQDFNLPVYEKEIIVTQEMSNNYIYLQLGKLYTPTGVEYFPKLDNTSTIFKYLIKTSDDLLWLFNPTISLKEEYVYELQNDIDMSMINFTLKYGNNLNVKSLPYLPTSKCNFYGKLTSKEGYNFSISNLNTDLNLFQLI